MSLRRLRSGTSMMIALVVIGVVSITSLLCTRQCLMLARQQRRESAARQAQWIAISAVDRAAAALARDPNYKTETWSAELPAAGGGSSEFTTEIRVEREADRAGVRRVSVDVRSSEAGGARHTLSIEIPSSSDDAS